MLHKSKAMWVHDFQKGKGKQAGVICKDFRLIDFSSLQDPFWLICHLWFSRRGVIFTFSHFASWLLALQDGVQFRQQLATVSFVQGYEIQHFNVYSRGFLKTLVFSWLPPLTAWTSVFTHYGKKSGGRKRQEALCDNRNTLQKADCRVQGKEIQIMERLMQSAPTLSGGLVADEDV